MGNQDVLRETIIKWAATRRDEIVFEPSKAYYSWSIVADAYNRGVENATETAAKEAAKNDFTEKMRSILYGNAKHAVDATKQVISYLNENEFYPKKLFININIDSIAFIVTIKSDIYLTDKFIENAFTFSSQIQTTFHDSGINFQLSFMEDTEKVNSYLLRQDGFDIAFDLPTGNQIY